MGIGLVRTLVMVTMALTYLPNKHKDGGNTGGDAPQAFSALEGG